MTNRRAITPLQARAEGLDASEADRVDDWTGRRVRAVAAGRSRLPELAQGDGDGEVPDRFDAEEMSGEVEAVPSVMQRPYRMGFITWHEFEPGAFDESLQAQDQRIPIYTQHSWQWQARPPIGTTSDAREVDFSDDDGDTRALQITGRIWPDLDDGLATLHGLASRSLREWSIGYGIEEWTAEEDEEDGRRIIRISRADLLEASVVLRGANPWTQTLRVADAPTPTRVERGGLDRRWVAQMIEQSPSFGRAFAASDIPTSRR